MAIITKIQAVTLLAEVFNDQRLPGESNLALVQRIRNYQIAKAKNNIDSRLKQMAIDQYYIQNPTEQETVEDFE